MASNQGSQSNTLFFLNIFDLSQESSLQIVQVMSQ